MQLPLLMGLLRTGQQPPSIDVTLPKRSLALVSSLYPLRPSAAGAMRLWISFEAPRMPPANGHRSWLSWDQGDRQGPLVLGTLGSRLRCRELTPLVFSRPDDSEGPPTSPEILVGKMT